MEQKNKIHAQPVLSLSVIFPDRHERSVLVLVVEIASRDRLASVLVALGRDMLNPNLTI